MVLRRLNQRASVLRKARPPEARASMQELASDSVVQPDTARDLLNVSANFFRQVGHFVNEGDLCSQKCVRGIFDELGAATAGKKHRRPVKIEGPVDFSHKLARALVVSANHDSIRMFEVLNCCSFTQKFWIGDDRKINIGSGVANYASDLIAGTNWNGRFCDNHREATERSRYFARSRIDI